jgi:hypothetical protein
MNQNHFGRGKPTQPWWHMGPQLEKGSAIQRRHVVQHAMDGGQRRCPNRGARFELVGRLSCFWVMTGPHGGQATLGWLKNRTGFQPMAIPEKRKPFLVFQNFFQFATYFNSNQN